MLRIMVVEDDRQLATTLKYLVEDNPRYQVVAIADDLDSALDAAATHRPELALVDLRLAHGTTGFSVAVRLADEDIPVLFVTGKAPDFPMPDLALGCLMKPFTAEDVHRSLAMAEDMMRGTERTKHVPIIFVTAGSHDQQHVFKGYEFGRKIKATAINAMMSNVVRAGSII